MPANLTPAQQKVAKVQMALNSNGASLDVDGKWGSKTSAALAAFQKRTQPEADRQDERRDRQGAGHVIDGATPAAWPAWRLSLDRTNVRLPPTGMRGGHARAMALHIFPG